MRTTVVNKRDPGACFRADELTYIGRGSIWGNPFIIGKDGSREEVIAKYRTYIIERLRKEPALREALRKLRGKYLVCYCFPKKCHGDLLAQFADTGVPEEDDGEDESENEDEDL